MERSIIIAGFGGQGVLSMGKLICLTVDRMGRYATFFPSYGGEQRGGTCNCTVILSDDVVGSPIATRADYVIIMNEPSYAKFKGCVAPGGALLINESQVPVYEELPGIRTIGVLADDVAEQAGDRIASNMVMLGAFTALSAFAPADEVRCTIADAMRGKPAYLEINLNAFAAGLETKG